MIIFMNYWYMLILDVVMNSGVEEVRDELKKLMKKSQGILNEEQIDTIQMMREEMNKDIESGEEVLASIEKWSQIIADYATSLSIYLSISLYNGEVETDALILLESYGYDGTYGTVDVIGAYQDYALRRVYLDKNEIPRFPLLEPKMGIVRILGQETKQVFH